MNPPETFAAEPFDLVVVRTPLLPLAELEAWSADLAAPAAAAASASAGTLDAALKSDAARLRGRLEELLARPEVIEALYVASPSLVAGLAEWRRDPEGRKGRRAEQALVRYLVRMTSRPTPFGLFSGCTVGSLGPRTDLRLAPRTAYRRHTRLDRGYVEELCEGLGRDPELRRGLVWRPNTSLYRSGGRLRYAEGRTRDGARSYHLVAVDPEPFLECALARAEGGATRAELVEAVCAADPEGEVTPDEAEEFVGDLIDSQLLESDLAPAVTGQDALAGLAGRLAAVRAAAPLHERLAGVGEALAGLDRGGLGLPPERYAAIAGELEGLPAKVDPARLFQVDLIKPAGAGGLTLGPEVAAELGRAVAAMHRLARPPRADDGLARFREAFVERYGDGREVPLLEALDEELGVGFEAAPGADAAPLLAGIAGLNRAPDAPEASSGRWSAIDDLLAERLGTALAAGAAEIELSEADLAGLPQAAGAPPLPGAFEVLASLAADSPEALAAGEFRALLRSAAGPSGARLLGRFCHADAELRRQVEALLRAEERLEPDAIFAEVVHLPQGRIGNVTARPVLRAYEIPYLGRGGAPRERQIPAGDLAVSVSGGRVLLHSARLGRRVIPRLTHAHNYALRSQGVYRFLGALQGEGLQVGLSWHWGPLDVFPRLPRVRFGRTLLARAGWRVPGAEVRALALPGAAARYRAVQAWRERRGLPRRVVLPDGDHELTVDLDNPLAVDAFLSVAGERPRIALTEPFPEAGAGGLVVRGPEGGFVHELVLPFVRRGSPSPAAAPRILPVAAPAPPAPGVRSFAPGSEWLYAKLYTGSATADRVLAEVVAPVARRAIAGGAADRWFFLRYGDPRWHLRVRFAGDPRRLVGEVLPALAAAAAPALADGRLWKLQLDTYEREVERYGGPHGIEPAERLFHADSEAALALVEALDGEDAADLRWRLALAGCARLLDDLGFARAEQAAVVERVAAAFAREHGVDAAVRRQLAGRLRGDRAALAGLLAAGDDPAHPLAPGLAILARRSRDLAPAVAELRRHAKARRLTLPLTELAPSFLHMWVNRLLRAEARAHETVIYDFLHRLLREPERRAPAPRAAATDAAGVRR